MNDVDWETACISAGGFSWGDLSRERWPSIRTNNFMEQPHQKSCRRFRVMGRFPADNSLLLKMNVFRFSSEHVLHIL